MIVIEELARKWHKEKYGTDLPPDFHGIDYQWSKEEIEFAEKLLNGEIEDLNDNELVKKYGS